MKGPHQKAGRGKGGDGGRLGAKYQGLLFSNEQA